MATRTSVKPNLFKRVKLANLVLKRPKNNISRALLPGNRPLSFITPKVTILEPSQIATSDEIAVLVDDRAFTTYLKKIYEIAVTQMLANSEKWFKKKYDEPRLRDALKDTIDDDNLIICRIKRTVRRVTTELYDRLNQPIAMNGLDEVDDDVQANIILEFCGFEFRSTHIEPVFVAHAIRINSDLRMYGGVPSDDDQSDDDDQTLYYVPDGRSEMEEASPTEQVLDDLPETTEESEESGDVAEENVAEADAEENVAEEETAIAKED